MLYGDDPNVSGPAMAGVESVTGGGLPSAVGVAGDSDAVLVCPRTSGASSSWARAMPPQARTAKPAPAANTVRVGTFPLGAISRAGMLAKIAAECTARAFACATALLRQPQNDKLPAGIEILSWPFAAVLDMPKFPHPLGQFPSCGATHGSLADDAGVRSVGFIQAAIFDVEEGAWTFITRESGILWQDNVEIAGNDIAEGAPVSRHLGAQVGQHARREIGGG